MKIWKSAIPVLAAVLAAAGINGCYTMLIHPAVTVVDDSTQKEMLFEVNHGERCTDCHTGDVRKSVSGSGKQAEWPSGTSDYDPYWGNDYNGYYDPWFMSTSRYSTQFYDSYYQYNTVPWWVYYNTPASGGSSDDSVISREKPLRRGGISDSGRRDSSPSIGSTTGQDTGTEKTSSPAPKQDSSGADDSESDKQKPVRRGGIK